MGKRKCRMTEEELDIHEQAVHLRKMTDRQLVDVFRNSTRALSDVTEAEPINKTDSVKMLLEGLTRGECRGVKGATAYKVADYAAEKGLI
ncbi:MAG: hypothetical protein RR162_00185 [Oscillospiraceae bacterium]